MLKLARCVFDKKAESNYLSDFTKTGLHFRTRKGVAFFQPTNKKTSRNVLKISGLPSGRKSVDLTRSMLSGLFERMLEQPGDLCALHAAPSGWTRMEHVECSTKKPYCRVWRLATLKPDDWTQMAQRIMAVMATAQKFDEDDHQGAAPKAIREARNIMLSFDNIMAEAAHSQTRTDLAREAAATSGKRRLAAVI